MDCKNSNPAPQSSSPDKPQVRSCGVIVFRREPQLSFLLMKHRDRWDLPKGHVDPGESDVACALRELSEETGISDKLLELAPDFRYETYYEVLDRRYPLSPAHKTLVIFLGWLAQDVPIEVTEHEGHRWFDWSPPHRIQERTIDPLLAYLERYFSRR